MREATNSSLWSITRRSQPYDMYQGKGEPYHHVSIRKRIAFEFIITRTSKLFMAGDTSPDAYLAADLNLL